ncbi:hypothetical protein SDC9_146780 [bioreactor metagenome]|uniref:NAD-dependent epimerase/dehydratase domain-containing protein n=1 Tax=bioreactor metagenome TaxID=1076179 RepID=A0A645EEN8_9ZZZZ
MIVEAIQHQDQPPLLLFSSSISVYGDRIQDYWIRVGDPLKPSRGDYYAELKIQCEQLIQAASIPYVIFRLTGIMGYPTADPLMFHMPLDTHLEFASNCDTGFALAKAVQHRQELEGRIFNLGGGEGFRITYRSFIKNMLSIYGLNPCYLRQECFATKNFHCGYYADSDELNDILHFQRDNLDSYYARTLLATARPVYLINRLFGWLILRYLQHHSDPYQALRHHDQDLIDRFY